MGRDHVHRNKCYQILCDISSYGCLYVLMHVQISSIYLHVHVHVPSLYKLCMCIFIYTMYVHLMCVCVCVCVCRYDYRCVIYGWDHKCMMPEHWIAQMNVDRHPPGRHQPFYNVLAHDGSNRYATQGDVFNCITHTCTHTRTHAHTHTRTHTHTHTHTPSSTTHYYMYIRTCNIMQFPDNLIECPSDEMGPIPHWEVSRIM